MPRPNPLVGPRHKTLETCKSHFAPPPPPPPPPPLHGLANISDSLPPSLPPSPRHPPAFSHRPPALLSCATLPQHHTFHPAAVFGVFLLRHARQPRGIQHSNLKPNATAVCIQTMIGGMGPSYCVAATGGALRPEVCTLSWPRGARRIRQPRGEQHRNLKIHNQTNAAAWLPIIVWRPFGEGGGGVEEGELISSFLPLPLYHAM